MSTSQTILGKIAALRQSVELATASTPNSVQELEKKVSDGFQQTKLIDGSLRKLSDPGRSAKKVRLPAQLTARARRLLEQSRDLLGRLRALGARLTQAAVLSNDPPDDQDPLVQMYRETVAMVDTALRLVAAFPDAASAQLQLCAGLEGILVDISARTANLSASVERRFREVERVERLAEQLDLLEAGRAEKPDTIQALTDELLVEVQRGEPLRLLDNRVGTPAQAELGRRELARFIACHGLNVAQVIGRIVRHDPELKDRSRDAIIAALLHDVGMLRVPAHIVFRPELLDDAGRRIVEAHTLLPADALVKLFPEAQELAEAIAEHHERLDGTGYPSGRRELQLRPLVRLLAVCDVYAALCEWRPQRPAKDTRAALADTLLEAEQGGLDRERAERLLSLSFYPAGTLVELADGAVGVVVATHMGRRDVNTPASPVVAVLVDGQRRPLATPRHVDLTECEGRRIARSLPLSEGRKLLGRRYPDAA
jgi:HD-GYP domain-containing protein (c-di-GMP phosphodiesterase class II)